MTGITCGSRHFHFNGFMFENILPNVTRRKRPIPADFPAQRNALSFCVNVGNAIKANIADLPQTRANTGVLHIRFASMLALLLYCP